MGDMIKASGHLDLDNKPFHSGFGSPMSKYSLLKSLDQVNDQVVILFPREQKENLLESLSNCSDVLFSFVKATFIRHID